MIQSNAGDKENSSVSSPKPAAARPNFHLNLAQAHKVKRAEYRKKREPKSMRFQIDEIRRQAAITVAETSRSARERGNLYDRVFSVDRRMEVFEKKIDEIKRQHESTQRELETTRQYLQESTINSARNAASSNFFGG